MDSLPFASSRLLTSPFRTAAGDAPPDDTKSSAAPVRDRAAFAAAAAAVMAGGPHARILQRGWRETGQGRVVFEHRGARGRIEVSTAAPDAPSAWVQVEGFSALTLDALLAVDLAGRTDPEAVLQAKAYARCGDERRAFRAQVEAELERLRGLRLRLDGAEARPLVDILRGRAAPASARGQAAGPLRFDHRSNRGADVLAKKLAVWLSLQEGPEARKARQVRAVLAAIGELPVHIGERGARSGRLADRFDEALMRLEEAGLSRLRYRGESACAGDRARGWITRWLRQTVVVEPQPEPQPAPAPPRRPALS